MSDHSHHGHFNAEDEYLPVAGSSYEHTDADSGAVIRFGVWLAIIALATHGLIAAGFAGMTSFTASTGEPRYPVAVGQQTPQPPEPRLQAYPDRDMDSFRATDAGELNSYGWVDKQSGSVHIPIEDAMRRTLERGLPARAQDGAAVATPGMLATDASSGRVMERRRQ